MSHIPIPKGAKQTDDDNNLFDNLLNVIQEMIYIILKVKFKIESLFQDSLCNHFSKENRIEFINALLSQLAFTTEKIISTIPDMNIVASQESALLRDFFMQQACSLQENVFSYAKHIQNKVKNNDFILQINTNEDFGSILAHMIQTITLLRDSLNYYYPLFKKILSYIDIILEKSDEIITIILEAQNTEKTSSTIDFLLQYSNKKFKKIIDIIYKEYNKQDYLSQLKEDMINSIQVFLDEIDAISQNLTYDPIYSEQQASNIKIQIRKSFFNILCDLQVNLIQYPLKLELKREIVEIKASDKIKKENTQLTVPENTQSSGKRKRKRSFLFTLGRDNDKNNIIKQPKNTDKSNTLRQPIISRKKRREAAKSKSLPQCTNTDLINHLELSNLQRNNSGVDSMLTSTYIEKIRENEIKEKQEHKLEKIEENKQEKQEINVQKGKIYNIKEDNIQLKANRTDSFVQFSSSSSKESVFNKKKPKISRMVSKSRLIVERESPEVILYRTIFNTLENEYSWFKDNLEKEEEEMNNKVKTKIQSIIKRDLVLYGNKLRGPTPSTNLGSSNAATPRGTEALASISKSKNLSQFVDQSVVSGGTWKSLFATTTLLLSPLEIPRLRACVSPLGKAANNLLSMACSVIDSAIDRNLLSHLSDCVSFYYEKLEQIVCICIESPEKNIVLSFLDKPLRHIIQKAPITGEPHELLPILKEHYKLHLILGKLRHQIYNEANKFRALVIQIGSSIFGVSTDGKPITEMLIIQFVSNIICQLNIIKTILDLVVTSTKYLNQLSLSYENMEESSDDSSISDNIWSIEIPEHSEIHIGSLSSLVLEITQTDDEVDNYFVKAFLATYRAFSTPKQLFYKLTERYNVPDNIDKIEKTKVQLRVIIVLKYWIQSQFYDINEELLEHIINFVDSIKQSGKKNIAQQLENLLEQQKEERENAIKKLKNGELPSLDTNQIYELNPVSPADILFNHEPRIIAEHITMHEASIFYSIEISELLNQSWTKPDLQYLAPNVLRFIRSLNEISYWVATSILWHGDITKRAKSIEKFINIAICLHKIGNFNSLMGILGGLNLICISRLKHSFMGVADKLIKKFKYFDDVLMCPKSSWKEYRKELQNASLPRLPYLGVVLGDLTFIDNGNASIIDNSVNFDKHLMMYKELEQILICQQQKYEFKQIEPLRTFYSSLPSLGEDELWLLSQLREPKEARDH